MLRCTRGLRNIAGSARTVEEAATAIVGFLHSQSADPRTSEPQCALVRFYMTRPYDALDPDLQAFSRAKLRGSTPDPDTKVLTLMASYGSRPEWRDPRLSVDHQAIPLPSVEIVEQAPMIAQLIRALGIEITDVVKPRVSLLQDESGKTYNVFHVEKALGSPYIPAQDDFVKPHGIESVIGFGGLLPTGDLFAVVMFSQVSVPYEAAIRFRNVALDIKAILFQLGAT